jgi:hypothetical protein
MTNGAIAGGAAGGAAAAIIAEAIKASGAIIRVESADFETLLGKNENPMVVYREGGLFSTSYQYLMGYKGLVFYCKTSTPLILPAKVEVVRAKKIWIPS